MDRITDYRTDMYSFGISMWEAFTRELPFADRDVDELMYAHLTTKAADPRTKNPTIPKQLVDIIDKVSTFRVIMKF
jgi:histidine kinase